jgi:hypothetical protein
MGSSIGLLQRKNPLWRDLLFPFYTRSQFVLLCVLAGLAFLGAQLSDKGVPLIFAIIVWVSGTLQLSTVAPGALRLPLITEPDIREILASMRFAQTADPQRWSYRRPTWMKWPNSDVGFLVLDRDLVVSGPMSTLAYLRIRLRQEQRKRGQLIETSSPGDAFLRRPAGWRGLGVTLVVAAIVLVVVFHIVAHQTIALPLQFNDTVILTLFSIGVIFAYYGFRRR